jgi:putative oxidoreductase
MNTGLLILRIVFGLLLVGHGSQKLFGWFGGPGIAGTGGWFDSVGFRPGKSMAVVAGLSELVGGVLIAVGLLTPLASAIVIGTLLVATSVHLPNGLWAGNGGFEMPLLYITAAVTLAFTGPGAWSLDNAFGLDSLTTIPWAIAAVVVGVVSALVVIARARLTLKATPPVAQVHADA